MNQPLNPQTTQPKYKSQAFITKVVLNICLSCILIGFSNTCFSSIDYEEFVQIFQIKHHQALYQGILTGAIPLTASLGGILSSFLLSRFSRTHAFLVVNFFYIFVLAGLMVRNVHVIILFRLFQGCASGAFTSLVPLYNKQFSPLQLNGKMGTFFQMLTVFGLSLGFFLSFIFSLFFPTQIYWRMVFGFPIFLIAFQSYNLLYRYPYQTPKYLLSAQKYQQAKQLMSLIYKQQYVEQRLQQLKKMFNVSSNRNIQLKQIAGGDGIKDQNNGVKKQEVKYHNNWLAVFAAIHVATLQQFSGISVVIGYGAEIVKRVFPSLAKILPIFLHFQAVIACFITIQLLKTRGRKQLLQWGCIGCGLFTLTLGYNIVQLNEEGSKVSIFSGLLITIALFSYRFVYGITIGSITFLYIPEIVQPNVMPLVIILYYVAASFTVILFPIIRINVFNGNPGPIFIIFGVYTLFSYVINHYAVIQTKGKKQYQVRMQYDRKLGIHNKEHDDQGREMEVKFCSYQQEKR